MRKISISKAKKITLIALTIGLVSIPTTLNYTFKTWEGQKLVREVEKKTLDQESNPYNLNGEEINETPEFENFELQIQQDKTKKSDYVADIEFKLSGKAAESANEIQIILNPIAYYYSTWIVNNRPPGSNPVYSNEYWKPIVIDVDTNTLSANFKTPQTNWFRAEIYFDGVNSGETYFQPVSHRMSPNYKYNLKRSEGNNNPDRPWIADKNFEVSGNAGSPTTWGSFDLILDLREPSIHNNEHIYNGNYDDPSEFYNIYDYVNDVNEKFDITLHTDYNETIIYTGDIDNVGYYEKQQTDVLTGTYSTDKDRNIHGSDVEFFIREDGYLSLQIKNVIEINEDEYIYGKGEYMNGMYLEINNDLNGDGVYTEVENFNSHEDTANWASEDGETMIYAVDEASTDVMRHTWGNRKYTDDNYDKYVNGYTKGRPYYYFAFINPTGISAILLSTILLGFTVPVIIKNTKRDEIKEN